MPKTRNAEGGGKTGSAERWGNDTDGHEDQMTTFLFWNINKRPLQDRVAHLASRYAVDVLILAECAVDPDVMLRALNGGGGNLYSSPTILATKIKLFTKLSPNKVQERYGDDSGDLIICHLNVGSPPGLLLAGVHTPSKMDWSDSDQDFWASELVREIRREEGQIWSDRTILVGDFNMNPFDHGMVAAQGFHAVMTRELALKRERTVKRRAYPFFYNPMWGLFGDRTNGPSGTFYLRGSKPVNYFWNMYDQVLVRPGLAEKLKEVRIIDHDGVASLLTRFNLPEKSLGSDHLPILFELDP